MKKETKNVIWNTFALAGMVSGILTIGSVLREGVNVRDIKNSTIRTYDANGDKYPDLYMKNPDGNSYIFLGQEDGRYISVENNLESRLGDEKQNVERMYEIANAKLGESK